LPPTVLILADGAIWIWNLAQNRFKDACHRVDLWHVHEHLWTVARSVYGEDSPEAQEWIRPSCAGGNGGRTVRWT
jgi:hypothetical protein